MIEVEEPCSLKLATELGQMLMQRNWRISTAESCTGGLVSAALTNVDGSSGWFEYGVVSYANQAKEQLLGVKPEVIAQHGAVSEQVVRAMATGARNLSESDVAIAVSGVAGPGGGTVLKPVGTIWIGWAVPGDIVHAQDFLFSGDRYAVRQSAVDAALRGTIQRVQSLAN